MHDGKQLHLLVVHSIDQALRKTIYEMPAYVRLEAHCRERGSQYFCDCLVDTFFETIGHRGVTSESDSGGDCCRWWAGILPVTTRYRKVATEIATIVSGSSRE